MSNNLKYLLIGNSRLHWAEYKNNSYKFTHSRIKDPLSKTLNQDKLIWASVGDESNFKLNQNNQIKTEDINLLNIPHHFGVDRALSCFYASRKLENPNKKNIIIADFGTTLSITKINDEGELLGGQLIPGFNTQIKAMVENTKLLKEPHKLRIPNEKFLINTQEAMIKGVSSAIIGAINFSYNCKEDILVFCGGDSELFSKLMQSQTNRIILKPNLVMEGLICFSDYFFNKD